MNIDFGCAYEVLGHKTRHTLNSSPLPFSSLRTKSSTDTSTYRHMILPGPGNSGFCCWIQIPGCMYNNNFQECCSKSRALGKLWDVHIRPHLVSGRKNPDQFKGGNKSGRLQIGGFLYMLICGTQDWCSLVSTFPPYSWSHGGTYFPVSPTVRHGLTTDILAHSI
jgi:hypothetical protein